MSSNLGISTQKYVFEDVLVPSRFNCNRLATSFHRSTRFRELQQESAEKIIFDHLGNGVEAFQPMQFQPIIISTHYNFNPLQLNAIF